MPEVKQYIIQPVEKISIEENCIKFYHDYDYDYESQETTSIVFDNLEGYTVNNILVKELDFYNLTTGYELEVTITSLPTERKHLGKLEINIKNNLTKRDLASISVTCTGDEGYDIGLHAYIENSEEV